MGVIPSSEGTPILGITQKAQLNPGLKALKTEMKKVRSPGFKQGEFELAPNDLLRRMERSYMNRNDRRNVEFVQTNLHTTHQSRNRPDSESAWKLDSMLSKALKLEDINALEQQAIFPKNQVSVMSAPEKKSVLYATTEEIRLIRDKVRAAKFETYENNTVKDPLSPEGTTLEG